MSKKRNKQNADSQQMQPVPSRSGGGRFIAVALLVLGAGVFLYALNQDAPAAPQASSSTAAARQAPEAAPAHSHEYRYFETPEDAHPLPVTLPPSSFASPAIARSYAIAKEIPEVLAQQPCLCGCDNPSDDHRSLLDCFIDGHASTCMVCMKEAVYAKQMTNAGKSATWIRDAIVRHEFSDVNIGS